MTIPPWLGQSKMLCRPRLGNGLTMDRTFATNVICYGDNLDILPKPAEVEAIARQLDSAGSLMELPANTRKEIEYVLELAPLYFWLVGPGTIDPPRHVFQVTTNGHSAMFDRVPHLPAPPQPRPSNA